MRDKESQSYEDFLNSVSEFSERKEGREFLENISEFASLDEAPEQGCSRG